MRGRYNAAVVDAKRSARRRALVLALCLVLGMLLGLVGVVPPQSGRSVVSVARFGGSVRLLPAGLSLSFLPLARRVILQRRGGLAVIDATTDVALAGGAATPLAVRLSLEGSGTLPLDAARVRTVGWQSAWKEWLQGKVNLTAEEIDGLVRGSRLWRQIFPGAQAGAIPDVTARLAPAFSGARLRRAELEPDLAGDVVRAMARHEMAKRTGARGKLVLLGLDALDWSIVDDLARRGLMPNMVRLEKRSAHAVEHVSPPLISPVVWTTIATGVPPEEHGVLDFLEPDPSGGAPRPVSSASRKAPTVWEMMAAAGRSTAVIGWWATFPAQAPAGGAVYSDRLTEQLLGLSAQVPHLADPPQAEETARAMAIHAHDVTAQMLAPFATVSPAELAGVLARPNAWDEPLGGLAKLVAATETVERLTRHELDRGTQAVFSYLEGTDTVGHLFVSDMPPVMPGVDPVRARRFGAVVDRYYQHVDEWIGEVVSRLGRDDTLVIVSDHGFRWGENRLRVPAGTHTATAVLWHRPEGAFLAVGPGVRATGTRRDLDVIDVGPCLLALAGLPPAAEMPGTVPEWLLAGAPPRGTMVRYDLLLPPHKAVSVDLPPEAREEELAKLRALGYLAGGEEAKPSAPGTAGEPEPVAAGPVPAAPTPAFDRAEARQLNNLAISQATSGEKAAAEKTFKKAIAADPNYASPYASLSVMLRKEGRLDEADRLFWMSVRLGIAEREMAVVRLALDYRERGMPDKAKAVFAEGRGMFPDSGAIWLNSGVFLGEQGDFGEARACLERAVELEPKNPAAHRNLAVALLSLGDRDGARRELTLALDLDPSDAPTRQQLEALGGRLR
jgi:Flp pilus assembly protein TadD